MSAVSTPRGTDTATAPPCQTNSLAGTTNPCGWCGGPQHAPANCPVARAYESQRLAGLYDLSTTP